MYKISEIFASIDGEGITAGYPAVFVRFFGCNLRCSYCDSLYAVEKENPDSKPWKDMSTEAIIKEIKKYRINHVTLTGGEPLIQKDVYDLIRAILNINDDIIINIETNGAVDLLPLNLSSRYVNEERIIITMDWKSISSGCSDKMIKSNLNLLHSQDVLKFVVSNEDDLQQMKEIIDTNQIDATIFVSPVFGKIKPVQIVDYIVKNHMNSVRLQLQIHKIIWDPNKRGV